jgi:hypothetical protein
VPDHVIVALPQTGAFSVSGWLLLGALAVARGAPQQALAGEGAGEGRVVPWEVDRGQQAALPGAGVGVERGGRHRPRWPGLAGGAECIEGVGELVVVSGGLLLDVRAHGVVHVHWVLSNQWLNERVSIFSCRAERNQRQSSPVEHISMHQRLPL